MNKNAILGIVAVAVILIIAGFMIARTNTEQQINQEQTSPVAPESETGAVPAASEQKSLRDLLALGVSQQCAFTDDTANGTVYVSGSMIRSDFTIVSDDKSMTAHTIVRDNTSYFWTDDSTTGFKAAMNEVPHGSATASFDATTQSLDVDKKGDYSCSPWVVDDSMFTAPSTVVFNDYSQMLQGITMPK